MKAYQGIVTDSKYQIFGNCTQKSTPFACRECADSWVHAHGNVLGHVAKVLHPDPIQCIGSHEATS